MNKNTLALSRKKERLLRLHQLAAAGQMTASFVHQLRTPLQTIQSHVEFSLEFLAPVGPLKEKLEAILNNVQRLSRIIESLLRRARSQSIELANGDIILSVEEACRMAEDSAKKKKIAITRRLEKIPLVRHDPDLLEGALLNLLHNAIDATACGGMITVGLAKKNSGFEITIEDTGPGMDSSLLEQAGTPFLTTKENGTGLGIYMARQILELHGARLSLTNPLKGGCSAIISWP